MTSEPRTIDAHGRHAQAVAFSPDGGRLVSVGQDARVRVWNLPGLEAAGVFEGHGKCINTVSFAPGGDRLATSSTDATVRVWSFPEGQELAVLEKQTDAVFSPSGEHLATTNSRERVVLRDATAGYAEIATLPRLGQRVVGLAFTPDGRSLLVGGAGPIHVVSVPDGEKTGELQGHQVCVACVRFSPDGKLLASSGFEGSIRLWNTGDWSEIATIPLASKGILQMAFSPDGERLSLSVDGGIETYAVPSGEKLERIDLPLKGVYGVAVSPDGRWLANAAADGRIRVWDRG